jgi:hypothetical protein
MHKKYPDQSRTDPGWGGKYHWGCKKQESFWGGLSESNHARPRPKLKITPHHMNVTNCHRLIASRMRAVLFQNMSLVHFRIALCGGQRCMAEQLLYRPQIAAIG